MKIAIHSSRHSFSERWIPYCERNEIPFKIVDCNSNDIIRQLDDCDALMWHHFQTNPQSILFAKQLLFALEQSGKKVFPDFKSGWHFDDKVGQKYLLEAIGAPLVKSYVFYSRKKALDWVSNTEFPKVFKLRSGAGSSNVRLIESSGQARGIINKAFGRGFARYNAWSKLKEIQLRMKTGKAAQKDLLQGIAHIAIPPRYSKITGRETGYVYFQDFIADCSFDIRSKVIGNRCWAFKRMVRKNDFRASGSDFHIYSKADIPVDVIKTSFEISKRLGLQCVAFDFVLTQNNAPLLLEMSYGFGFTEGQFYGFWDDELNWHEERFDPFGWMVEDLIKSISE